MAHDASEHGEEWSTGTDDSGAFLTQNGTGTYLRWPYDLGTSDFTSEMTIVIDELEGSAATFEFNGDSHFGFEGGCTCVFAEGPMFQFFKYSSDGVSPGTCQNPPTCNTNTGCCNLGTPADMGIRNGLKMDFEVARRGNDFNFIINGVQRWTFSSTAPVTQLGLRPWRATMRLYDWRIHLPARVCSAHSGRFGPSCADQLWRVPLSVTKAGSASRSEAFCSPAAATELARAGARAACAVENVLASDLQFARLGYVDPPAAWVGHDVTSCIQLELGASMPVKGVHLVAASTDDGTSTCADTCPNCNTEGTIVVYLSETNKSADFFPVSMISLPLDNTPNGDGPKIDDIIDFDGGPYSGSFMAVCRAGGTGQEVKIDFVSAVAVLGDGNSPLSTCTLDRPQLQLPPNMCPVLPGTATGMVDLGEAVKANGDCGQHSWGFCDYVFDSPACLPENVYQMDGQYVGIAYKQQHSMPQWDGHYVSACFEVDFGGPTTAVGVKIVAAASDEAVCGVSCSGEYCATSGAMHIFTGASPTRNYETFHYQTTVSLPMDDSPGDTRHGDMMDTVVEFGTPTPVRYVAFCRSGAGGARDHLVMDFAALVIADGEKCPDKDMVPEPSKIRNGGLEAYYSFDAEQADDSSGNRRNGVWEDSNGRTATGAYGDGHGGGRAAKFDDNSRIAVHAFESFEWGDRFSVSLFFKRTGGEGNYQGIVNNGYYNHGSFEIRMGREQGGQMLGGGVITENHGEAWDHVGLTAAINEWHHVAMVYNDEKVHFYVDGVPEPHATDDSGNMVEVSNPVYIGQAGDGTDHEYFVGLIDEVKLYTRVLEEFEIADECGCNIVPRPLPPPPRIGSGDLDAFWSFDSSSATDETGNGFDGDWEGNESYDIGHAGGGMAASFDGSSRIVVNAFANFVWGDHFSVSIFFKRTGQEDNYQGIVNNGYYDHGSFEIRMGREQGGQMLGAGVITDGHAEAWDHVGITAALHSWHHVALVYDDSRLQFYLDGTPEAHASNDDGNMVVRDTPVVIGQAGPGTDHEYFYGLIDELKIWTRGLTEDEIAAECGCKIVHPPPPPPPGVAKGDIELYFHFEEPNLDNKVGDENGECFDGRVHIDGCVYDASDLGRNGMWEDSNGRTATEAYGDGHGGGRAAKFDDNSRIAVHAFESFEWGDRFSVSIFFKRTGVGNYQGIVNNGYYNHGSFEIRMGDEQGGQMLGGGVITEGHAEAWDHVGLTAAINEWHHVAMVYNDEQVNFWVDGNPEEHATNDSGNMVVRDTPVYIGQAGPGTDHEYFVGLIDEVKIFTKALSVQELQIECGDGCTVLPSPAPPPAEPPPAVGDCRIIAAVQTIENGAAVDNNGGMMSFNFVMGPGNPIPSPATFNGVKCEAIGGHENGQHDEIVAVQLSRTCQQSSFAVYGADRSVPNTELRHVRVAYGMTGTNWTCWIESDAPPQEGVSLEIPQTDCSTYGATHMPSGAVFIIPGPAEYIEFAFWGRTDIYEIELVSCDSSSIKSPPLAVLPPISTGQSIEQAVVSNSNAANDMLNFDFTSSTHKDAPAVINGVLCEPINEDEQHDEVVAVKLSESCGSSSFAIFGRDRQAAETDLRHIRVAYSPDGSAWTCFVQSGTPSVGGTPGFSAASADCSAGPSHAQSGAVFNVPFPARYVEFAFWGRTEIFEIELVSCGDTPPAPGIGMFNGVQIASAKLSVDNAANRMLSWPYADGTPAPEVIDGLHDPIGGHEDGQHDEVVAVELSGVCTSSSFSVFGRDRSVTETNLRHTRVAYSMDGSSWTCYTHSYSLSQGDTPPFSPASRNCNEGPSHAPSGAIFLVPERAKYVEFAFWGRTDVYEISLESCELQPPPPPPEPIPVNGVWIQEGRISIDDQAYNMLTWNFAAGIPTPAIFDRDHNPIGGHENAQHDDIVAIHLSAVCSSSSFAIYGADRVYDGVNHSPATNLRHTRVAYSLGGTTWTCHTQSDTPSQGDTPPFNPASDSCSEGPSHAASGAVFNIPFPAEFVAFAFWGRTDVYEVELVSCDTTPPALDAGLVVHFPMDGVLDNGVQQVGNVDGDERVRGDSYGYGSVVVDTSPFGNDGTTAGAVADGRFCRGRGFGCASECCECHFCGGCANDSPQGITIPTSASLEFGLGSFSVMGWAKFDNYEYPRTSFVAKNGHGCYFHQAHEHASGVERAGWNPGWEIGHGFVANGANVCIRDSDNNKARGNLLYDGGSQPPDLLGRWAHYAFVFDRTTNGAHRAHAFIDGVQQHHSLDISNVVGSISRGR
jgi:hypothetical protein